MVSALAPTGMSATRAANKDANAIESAIAHRTGLWP
jgi:hypothetical protein